MMTLHPSRAEWELTGHAEIGKASMIGSMNKRMPEGLVLRHEGASTYGQIKVRTIEDGFYGACEIRPHQHKMQQPQRIPRKATATARWSTLNRIIEDHHYGQ